MHYLTVQDHLWINLLVTGTKNEFDYAVLEEATFFQYAYGDSDEVLAQADRYGARFAAKAPFTTGNEATGFVGLISFLRLNGYEVDLTDSKGADFFASLAENKESSVRQIARYIPHHHGETVAIAVQEILKTYPKTIKSLSKQAVA